MSWFWYKTPGHCLLPFLLLFYLKIQFSKFLLFIFQRAEEYIYKHRDKGIMGVGVETLLYKVPLTTFFFIFLFFSSFHCQHHYDLNLWRITLFFFSYSTELSQSCTVKHNNESSWFLPVPSFSILTWVLQRSQSIFAITLLQTMNEGHYIVIAPNTPSRSLSVKVLLISLILE